ncbi:GPI transamidase component [Wickerhamomyces ciferrii]|uniref:GPI transamidase component n=1 Tax=Wickerhamomyces ciferrii (strain ATCC 14091 / BCRC 22168 / CBS 111 / JCM 3599 / NBRC 0793 / NRRL Y-1031 F-60-10) TaxID=1206466 RepID=K0KGK2_WICCF|nr:GPI transamidase component [Wickerhamomyces ciferrii]CCH44270.1 GPI transamidase component [Wickerhamomyces ciferrii]
MALLERAHKTIVRLGLIPKVIKALPKISILLSIIGLIWIAVLPLDGQYRGTYFSENALMPSQAYSYFRESEWNLLRGYRTQLKGFQIDELENNLQTMEIWLKDIGYKTHIQHSDKGSNLYGIWHAPRGDDTEAIVLGAAYFNSDNIFNIGGLSLAISMARYFHRWNVWSKNIIIVIPENPNSALRSWVNAYHSDLDLTGGSIEGAIMLDYSSSSDNFEYIELFYEGINGQLPNLDLVNVAVSVSEHEGPRVSIQKTSQEELGRFDYWSRLRILVRGIIELSLAGLKPGHGNEAFSGWRIQSLTLKAHGESGPYDITTFGRIPEAIFRSINNLLEKFHQSFFFYFLLAPRKFVSIGTYLPSAALITSSYILSSLNHVLNSNFEIVHLLSFGVLSGGFFIGCISIGVLISQVFPLLPIEASYGLILLFGIISISINFIKIPGSQELKIVLKSISLLYYGTVLSSLLVLNFALTFTIGICAFPLTLINDQQPTFKKILLLLISNPFLLSILISQDFENGLSELIKGLIISWDEFNCHTWFIICIGWLPSWLGIVLSLLINDDSRTLNEKKTN